MLADRVAESFVNDGIISEEEQSVVRFGLECLEGDLLGALLTLVIGICFDRVEVSLLLWLFLFPMRRNAGGYHAKTRLNCLATTVVNLMISFLLFTKTWHSVTYIMFVVAAPCIIWRLAPVDNPVKRLDVTERDVYRNRTRFFLKVDLFLLLTALCSECCILVESISMTLYITCVSLVMALLKQVYGKS